MNKELLEKLSAIREDLVALYAQVEAKDLKKLADLVNQKGSAMQKSYRELWPYMTSLEQGVWINNRVGAFLTLAQAYLERLGDEEVVISLLIEELANVPRMLADLDEIESKLKQPLKSED